MIVCVCVCVCVCVRVHMCVCACGYAVFDIRFGVDGRNSTHPSWSLVQGGVSHRQSCKTAVLTVEVSHRQKPFTTVRIFTPSPCSRRRKVTVEAQVASFTCKCHTYWIPGRRNHGLRVFVGENFNKERLVDRRFLLNFFSNNYTHAESKRIC